MSAWVICFLWNWPFFNSFSLFIRIFLGEEIFSVVQLLLVSMNCSKGSLIMLKGGLSNMLQTFERDARFYLNAILFLFSFISFLFIPPSFFCKQSTQLTVFSKNQFIADCSCKCETFNNNDLKLGLKILLSNS